MAEYLAKVLFSITGLIETCWKQVVDIRSRLNNVWGTPVHLYRNFLTFIATAVFVAYQVKHVIELFGLFTVVSFFVPVLLFCIVHFLLPNKFVLFTANWLHFLILSVTRFCVRYWLFQQVCSCHIVPKQHAVHLLETFCKMLNNFIKNQGFYIL